MISPPTLPRALLICLVIALLVCRAHSASTVHPIGANNTNSRSLCYSGSVMYQTNTVDCTTQDPSYGGTWFCSNIHVCETGINPNRVCMSAKGCAKQEQCMNPDGGVLSNSPLLLNGVAPGGMTVTVSCCPSVPISTDDSTAIDYNLICNDSTKTTSVSYALWLASSMAVATLLLIHS